MLNIKTSVVIYNILNRHSRYLYVDKVRYKFFYTHLPYAFLHEFKQYKFFRQ